MSNYKPVLSTVACALIAALAIYAAVSDRARALHDRAFVFDGHIHAIDREFYKGGDIGERKSNGAAAGLQRMATLGEA